MDNYFLNNQGAFNVSLYRVYNRIRENILNSISTYIQMNTCYTYKNEPILLDIINTPEYYNALKITLTEISKADFEKHIPNYQAGLSYVDLYQPNSLFYINPPNYEGDSVSYIMVMDDTIVMFFDLKGLIN